MSAASATTPDGGPRPTRHTILRLRLAAFFILVSCLTAQCSAAVLLQQQLLSNPKPPLQLIGREGQDREVRGSASCVPQVDGWDSVRGATLQDIGYHAAAVSLGRHILVLGGLAAVPDSVDVVTYMLRHAQRGMNLFNPSEEKMEELAVLLPNMSSVACPQPPTQPPLQQQHQQQELNVEGQEERTMADVSAARLARRCIEAQRGHATAAAVLPVPVVGAGSVVRVRNRVYAFGACNIIPDSVRIDLLRSGEATAAATTQEEQQWHSSSASVLDETAESPVRGVELYLRSVLRIDVYLGDKTHTGTHVVHHERLYQPSSLTLRYNATCVAGAHGVVYIVGGVDARTGEALATVTEFDTESGSFVDGAWTLDRPVSTPAAASDSTLIFFSGGVSHERNPSIFNPTRLKRDYHTHIDVLDTRRNFFVSDVARYASEDDAVAKLQWTAPQMFVRGTSLWVVGTGGTRPYSGVAYWANLSRSPSASYWSSLAATTAAGDEAQQKEEKDGRSLIKRLEMGSNASGEGVRATRVLPYAEFTLVPARRDAVVAMVPAEDGRSVTLYLFAGRMPSSAGGGVALDVFKARVQLCVADAAVGGGDGGDDTINDSPQVSKASPGGGSATELASVLPRALGFLYSREGPSLQQQQHMMMSVQEEKTAVSANTIVGKIATAGATTPLSKDRDDDACASVNGYAPLWYNVTFSVLLSYEETRQACPEIERHRLDPANSTTFSACAVLLSSSPQCDEPVVEFTHLSMQNVRTVHVPLSASSGKAEGIGRTVKAYAVAQALFIGSLERGLVQVLSSGNDGRSAVIGDTSHHHHHEHSAMAAPHQHGVATDTGSALYFEQNLVYVCFSRRSGVVANCASDQQKTQGAMPSPGVAATLDGWPAACSTPFYEALSPTDGGFLLANYSTCSADGDDDKPTESPTPASRHLLRPWMLLSTLILLLVVIVAYMLVTFVLMPTYAFSRQGRHHTGSDNVAVMSGADPDQQRSLLPYREARVFLGVGGVGGLGGANGADSLAYDDLPDEYETALTAAGLGGIEAGWDTGETATRRRKLLDGKYEVIRKLGKGSFSVVYLVRRITDNTTYALKYLQCSDDVDRHEAMKECEVVYALQGHPNVIQLFDMFMSYRFDRHMVTVPRSRKTREAAAGEKQRIARGANETTGKTSAAVGAAEEGERPSLVAIAGTEASPAYSHGSTHPLPPQQPVHDDAAGVSHGLVDLPVPSNPNAHDAAELSTGDSTLHQRSFSDKVVEGKAVGHCSASGQDAAAGTSEQQSPLTPSNTNTTSAETSTASRPIVHMDSNYFDAMAAGVLQDDCSESPTTPHYPRSEPEQQQQQHEQNHQQQQRGGEDGPHAAPPNHRRGLSTLQAERYLSLVMAYHERGDLARWVRQRRALQPLIPEATIVSIAFQVLSLLSYMHHRHQPPIIHRDLKPENILLTTHVRYENVNDDFLPIVVTDFGLSRVMDKTFCETGVGSLPYVAPECWQRRYSAKVDIWSLGCVLYAVCTKRVDSHNVKVMFSECTSPDFHDRLRHELQNIYGYSDALAWFITALLAVKPDDRPTASEALRMLRRQPVNEKGQPRFHGPPLAALLRAPTATALLDPQQQQQQQASAVAPSVGGASAEQPRQQQKQASHRKHPTPLPTLQVSAAQDSFALGSTAPTSEASATPLEVREAAVPPSSPPQNETASALTTAAAAVVSSSSLLVHTGPPSWGLSSTQPPHSARRLAGQGEEAAMRTPRPADLQPIASLSGLSVASTAQRSPTPQ